MLILSATALIAVSVVLTIVGLWMARNRPETTAAKTSSEQMSHGELALAWGICAAPLGFVFLVGDRRMGNNWVQLASLILIAIGLGCVIIRRVVYGRWN